MTQCINQLTQVPKRQINNFEVKLSFRDWEFRLEKL